MLGGIAKKPLGLLKNNGVINDAAVKKAGVVAGAAASKITSTVYQEKIKPKSVQNEND